MLLDLWELYSQYFQEVLLTLYNILCILLCLGLLLLNYGLLWLLAKILSAPTMSDIDEGHQ